MGSSGGGEVGREGGREAGEGLQPSQMKCKSAAARTKSSRKATNNPTQPSSEISRGNSSAAATAAVAVAGSAAAAILRALRNLMRCVVIAIPEPQSARQRCAIGRAICVLVFI